MASFCLYRLDGGRSGQVSPVRMTQTLRIVHCRTWQWAAERKSADAYYDDRKSGLPFEGRSARYKELCGIVGYTHKNWSPPPRRIQDATATLIHRGPDQQGVFQSSLFSVGAARLKIIDLDSGNQPILSEDGDFGIAFNGEIYNHLEIRAKLEKLGHRFESHSDTETGLRAFMQWDNESLPN